MTWKWNLVEQWTIGISAGDPLVPPPDSLWALISLITVPVNASSSRAACQ